MQDTFVAVLMGSDSDLPQMQPALDTLKKFGIRCEAKVTSAHRTPAATHAYVTDAEQRGCGVFIAAAGMAAHLAGAGWAVEPFRPLTAPPGVRNYSVSVSRFRRRTIFHHTRKRAYPHESPGPGQTGHRL